MQRRINFPIGWMLRALGHAAWVLPMLLCASAILTPTLQIEPGLETTRITAPLRSDGSIDYLSAIDEHFRAGVTIENNAAVPILQALGRAALAPSQCDAITDRMGMQPLAEEGDYYLTHDAFCLERGLAMELDPRDSLGRIALPLKLGPATAQWLDYLSKPMALIAEASKGSKFFILLNGCDACQNATQINRPYIDLLRQIDRPFVTRAMLRLQAGDFAGFHDDVMTLHRLARLLGGAPTVVERLYVGAMCLETAACQIDRAAAQSGRLSADQARQLTRELAAIGELRPFDEALNVGERYLWLDVLELLARSSPTEAEHIISKLGDELPTINPPYQHSAHAARS